MTKNVFFVRHELPENWYGHGSRFYNSCSKKRCASIILLNAFGGVKRCHGTGMVRDLFASSGKNAGTIALDERSFHKNING